MRAVRIERVASKSIVVRIVMVLLRFALRLWHVCKRLLWDEPVVRRSSRSWLVSEDQTKGFSKP